MVLLFQLFHRFERFKKVLGRKGKIENHTYDVNPKLERITKKQNLCDLELRKDFIDTITET